MSWQPKGTPPGGGNGPWGRPGNNAPGPTPPGGGGSNGTPPDFDAFWQQMQARFRRVMGDGHSPGRPLALGAAAIMTLWLLSGVYMVDTSEQGVELIFGQLHETTGPGLHYNFPSPIGQVFTPEVTTGEQGGDRLPFHGAQRGAMQDVPEESIMLTGDKNLVKIHYEVQWQVGDPGALSFCRDEPDSTVKPVAESAMREVVGNTPIDTVFNEKERIAQDTRQLMQRVLDSYHTGIQIDRVVMLEADAPSQVVMPLSTCFRPSRNLTRRRSGRGATSRGLFPWPKGRRRR